MAHELAPHVPSFNHSVVLHVPEAIDASRLRSAVQAVVADHDALRGRILADGPIGWGVSIGEPATVTANCVQFSAADREDRIRGHVNRPFDLRTEAPVRVGWWSAGDSVCQLTFHHVATDARTIDLLLGDIASRYDGTGPGSVSSYYELAQHRWLRAADYESRLDDYARTVAATDLQPLLGGVRELHRAPVDVSFTPDRVVWRTVEAKAAALGVTRFAVWLTAWTRALTAFTGRHSFPITVPISTRQSPEELQTVGFFVNSVVVPIRHSDGESFDASVVRVARSLLDALDRRDIPLHELAGRLDLEHRGHDNPLTAISAQLGPVADATLALRDGIVRLSRLEADAPRYQLSFEVNERGQGGLLRMRGDAGLIERSRLQALGGLIASDLLERDSNHESPRIGGHRRRSWSDTICPAEDESDEVPRGVLGHILAQLQARGDQLAVQWQAERWSWTELSAAVDAIRAELVQAGAVAGDAVLVVLPRGPASVAALIAILDINAVAVMTRPEFSDSWRREITQAVGSSIMVTGTAIRAEVHIQGPRQEPTLPQGTAYVVFTSGSSGRPKGIPTAASSARQYLEWIADTVPLGPADRCLQLASPGFDAMIRDTLAPLRAGATLVMPADELRLSGAGLYRAIGEQDVTAILAFVPAQLRRLLREARASGPISSLKTICVAGEPLFRTDVADLEVLVPNGQLLNLYGPTEATMTTTSLAVQPAAESSARLPVGSPRPGTGVLVVNENGEEVPEGAVGQVFITGSGVCRGYLALDLQETSRRFRSWHVGGEERYGYATGDLGYWLSDGLGLRIEGRLDAERKLHGERIDLAAVESVLTSHHAISDVLASIDGDSTGAMLVAHVVWTAAPDEAGLRAFVTERLPPAARPRRIVSVRSVRRLTNGKIDRHALHAPASDRGVADSGDGPWPRIRDVVRQVTGAIPEDPEVSLFELGCDSLQLIEIADRLGLRTPRSDGVARMFDDPRCRTLLRLLRDGSDDLAVEGERRSSLTQIDRGTSGDAPTIVACPHAGGDVPVFEPLADGLDGAATLLVLRRPTSASRTGRVAAWLDEYIEREADTLARHGRVSILCGYSIGFTVAYLLARGLATDHGLAPSLVVGINASVPGGPKGLIDQPFNGTLDVVLQDRLNADLSLRSTEPVPTNLRLPALLLVNSTPDVANWHTAGSDILDGFRSVTQVSLPSAHLLTSAEMRDVGKLVRQAVERLR